MLETQYWRFGCMYGINKDANYPNVCIASSQ